MQDASTRVVMFEMCGNDYLQARSSFKSASGTCNYSGLNTAFANCKNYTQLAMDSINTFASASLPSPVEGVRWPKKERTVLASVFSS